MNFRGTHSDYSKPQLNFLNEIWLRSVCGASLEEGAKGASPFFWEIPLHVPVGPFLPTWGGCVIFMVF